MNARLETMLEMLGPDATLADAQALDEAGVSLSDTALQWVRDGAGSPPSASALLDIYDALSDSRKADLVECAKVIALSP